MLPMVPTAGLEKQFGLNARRVPVGSVPVTFSFGSHRTLGRAFIEPPVKSVIGVQATVSAPVAAFKVLAPAVVPSGQVCPKLTGVEAPE